MDYSPPDSSFLRISQQRILELVAISFSRDLPDPEIELASRALQADSLLLSHQGSPRNFYTSSIRLRRVGHH